PRVAPARGGGRLPAFHPAQLVLLHAVGCPCRSRGRRSRGARLGVEDHAFGIAGRATVGRAVRALPHLLALPRSRLDRIVRAGDPLMTVMTSTAAQPLDRWTGGVCPFSAGWRKVMMWWFIVTDGLLFAGFLASYGYARILATHWPQPDAVFSLKYIAAMTFVLITSS